MVHNNYRDINTMKVVIGNCLGELAKNDSLCMFNIDTILCVMYAYVFMCV